LNAEKFLASVKNNTAPFLASEEALSFSEERDIHLAHKAVRSAETGRVFRGTNQLLAQISLKEIGSPESEIITYQQARNRDTFIKKGSSHFTLTSYDAEKKESIAYRYFSVTAVADQKKLPALSERPANNIVVVSCSDTEPEKYLGKYLTAVSLDACFETDVKTMRAFKANLEKDLEKSFAEGRHTRVFELGNKASEICRDTMRDMFREDKSREQNQRERSPQHKESRQQSRDAGYSGYAG
jgi:hypothetical protein